MKKVVAFILSLVYLVTSNGTIIDSHYCMGKFIGADISVSKNNSGKCSNCGMAKENRKGCCNDKHTTIKLCNDQIFIANNVIANNTVVELNNQYPSTEIFLNPANQYISFTAHSPPIKSPSLFLLKCVFRI